MVRVTFGGMETNKQENSEPVKFTSAYLQSEAKALKALIRREAREQGAKISFDAGFTVGINARGEPFLQVSYRWNGNPQVGNEAL
jgi:hypothetical protein